MTEDFKDYQVLGPLSQRPVKPVHPYVACTKCKTLYYNDTLATTPLYCPEGCGCVLTMLSGTDLLSARDRFREYLPNG